VDASAHGDPGTRSETTISRTSTTGPGTLPADFEQLVLDHLDEIADERAVEVLHEHRAEWVRLLERTLDERRRTLEDLRRRLQGVERDLAVADFETDVRRVAQVLADASGRSLDEWGDEVRSTRTHAAEADDHPGPDEIDAAEPEDATPGVATLQLSWSPGRLVAWAAGRNAVPDTAEELRERLRSAGTGSVPWEEHRQVKLPDGSRADAVATPIGSVLGWLVALRTTADDEAVGAGATWLGLVAALAVRLAAQGRMVPQLKKARRQGEGRGSEGRGGDRSWFEVRWAPALVDEETMAALAGSMPGSVLLADDRQDPRATTSAILADLLGVLCGNAARRIEVPAPPPEPKSNADVAEALLARLDGTPFETPARAGAEIGRRLEQWARPVTGAATRLVVQLDPPDDGGAWYLSVFAPAERNRLEPVETALVTSSPERRKDVQFQLTRLERLVPELLRPGARRRGEVVLDQGEAWRLMTETGEALTAAGYDVRVPPLSRRKPSPGLRLTSMDAQETVVGAQQLANVRWSAVFDDVELTAEDINRLAAQARPLVKSRGRWIELDRADLVEAAAALAERASTTRLTGAEMLRHALGLEGSALAGGVSLSGAGWAADLLRSASGLPERMQSRPEGFRGELRSYQAEAWAWLGFLAEAGLGGCLALDMGLGKTPTMLAHLASLQGNGPALVVAPPAVVGNWATEAAKFVPGLRVVVHHGASRVDDEDVPTMAAHNDVVITTYGTAVRDVEALEQVSWATVVLDEAQAIKNPTSDTARQLRRLQARSRVALTGTPIENGLGDLWAILDWANPGLVGSRPSFVAQLSQAGGGKDAAERALRALNGILVFRRTKAEPAIAAELPDRIDELAHCGMTAEQIGLYQAVLDELIVKTTVDQGPGAPRQKGAVLAAITALKQICNHPAAYQADELPLAGRSGKLARLDEIIDNVFAAEERILVFTHFASWGEKLAAYLTERTGVPIACYHGGLARGTRDQLVADFQAGTGRGAMVLSLKAGGTGLNLTSASHVVLYDRWWNPAVEDQARDRVWRIGQTKTVICHRLVCPGTVDERVEEVVAGKRQVADMVLPKASSIDDLDTDQLRQALGIDASQLLIEEPEPDTGTAEPMGPEPDTEPVGAGAEVAG
jgi:superfamily II DNA or RNA helicase